MNIEPKTQMNRGMSKSSLMPYVGIDKFGNVQKIIPHFMYFYDDKGKMMKRQNSFKR